MSPQADLHLHIITKQQRVIRKKLFHKVKRDYILICFIFFIYLTTFYKPPLLFGATICIDSAAVAALSLGACAYICTSTYLE